LQPVTIRLFKIATIFGRTLEDLFAKIMPTSAPKSSLAARDVDVGIGRGRQDGLSESSGMSLGELANRLEMSHPGVGFSVAKGTDHCEWGRIPLDWL